MRMNLIDIGKLLESVADFECGTHSEVEIRLRTNGKVSFMIHSHDDDVKRTVSFKDIDEAQRFFE